MFEQAIEGLKNLTKLASDLKAGIDAQESMTPEDAVFAVQAMEHEGELDAAEYLVWTSIFTSLPKVLPLLRKSFFGLLQGRWHELAEPEAPPAPEVK